MILFEMTLIERVEDRSSCLLRFLHRVIAPAFFVFGGTHVGSSCWGGLVALIDQIGHHCVGFLTTALYALGHLGSGASLFFQDPTIGNNAVREPDVNGNVVSVPGFHAARGWDATTGWGTPEVETLLPELALLRL